VVDGRERLFSTDDFEKVGETKTSSRRGGGTSEKLSTQKSTGRFGRNYMFCWAKAENNFVCLLKLKKNTIISRF
jgi:hypothetical protein